MAQHGRRRAYGQHFLRDRGLCDRLASLAVDEAIARGARSLLEVGPGKGALTLPLAERLRAPEAARLEEWVISEADPRLVEYWRGEEPARSLEGARARLAPGDFLELPESEWLARPPLAVISNLPYSAGTAILTRLARHPAKIPVMVLMFQAEVAHRLRAEPGEKAWGSLSVWIQNRWDVKKVAHVPPGAFAPPPEVDSEVVMLTPRAEPRVALPGTPEAEKRWDELLRVAFAHRRKMLRSGLPPGGPWRAALERAGIDGTKRAEALSWDEWARFAAALTAGS